MRPDETDDQALARELREETGFELASVDELVAVVDERRPGIEAGVVLDMQSRYYRVVLGSPGATSLEDDEAALGLEAVWLTPEDAVHRQRRSLDRDAQPWAQRELAVLELLASVDLRP